MIRDVEAEITFLRTEDGGRSAPVWDGYRPQFYYDGNDWDALHEYPDVQPVNPVDKVRAYLRFLSPIEHFGKVRPGMAFLLREGRRIVGYGSVTRLIDLERSAAEARSQAESEP